MSASINEREIYAQINEKAQKHGVLFYGTDFFAELPTAELQSAFCVEETILNRSVKGARIKDLQEMLEVGVFGVAPSKIFLNIGENDLQDASFSPSDFLAQYEWLLYSIHSRLKCRIFVVSIAAKDPRAATVNQKLQVLAKECGCRYIDLTPALFCEKPVLRMFDILKFYVRSHPISFVDAMNLVPVSGKA